MNDYKYKNLSLYLPILTSLITVVFAFFLSKTHDENITLKGNINKMEEQQAHFSSDIDNIKKTINSINYIQAKINDKVTEIRLLYADKKFVLNLTNKIDKEFKNNMARFGNVMYSDRQELFYLIYNNTQILQFMAGKYNLNTKFIKSKGLDPKTKMPYENYESLGG